MQAEIDGKLTIIPFNNSGLTYMEILKNKVIELIECGPRNNLRKDFIFFNVTFGYNTGFYAYISRFGTYTDDTFLTLGEYGDEIVIESIDKIKFNEDNNCFEAKIPQPVQQTNDLCYNPIFNIVTKYLCDVTDSYLYHSKYKTNAKNILFICIIFRDVYCYIHLFDVMEVIIKFSDDKIATHHEHNETTLIIKNAFDNLLLKYNRLVSGKLLANLVVEYINTGLNNDVLEIIESPEFEDFIKEIAKFEEFRYIKGGKGWLPKVKAAVKDDE